MTALAEHRRALTYCATCPKLCRFACPVSNAEVRETVTPWGKMTAAYQHLSLARPLDEAAAAATYACTGCMRCRTHCRHGNEVGLALYAARAEAVRAGVAPAPVRSLLERFRPERPLGKSLRESREALDRNRDARSDGRVAYFPGCTALSRLPELVTDALDAARAVGPALCLSDAVERCCGYPLLAAGLAEAFADAARTLVAAARGVRTLVVGDPGCAFTMRVAYPREGVRVPFAVEDWVSVVATRVGVATDRRPHRALAAAYHDACHLGRGLGRYDEPRALLRAAIGDFAEGPESRDDAGCSGGGGLLPRTMPTTAHAMAEALGAELGAKGRTVVTACPTARRMLDRAGVRASDLISVVARWLSARGT